MVMWYKREEQPIDLRSGIFLPSQERLSVHYFCTLLNTYMIPFHLGDVSLGLLALWPPSGD